MQNQKAVAQNISLNGGIYKWISIIKNTRKFHGNMSKTICVILDEAYKQDMKITFDDGKQYTLKELENMVNNTYYEFYDIRVSFKKITSKFKVAFNNIQNANLKAALYNFIKALTIYLDKTKISVLRGVELSSSSNLAIYLGGYLMLYIDVNHVINDTIHISRFLQFNQQHFQPDDAFVWKEILDCLGLSYIEEIRITEDDLNKLTQHFLSL